MSDKLTKREIEDQNPLVIVSATGQFLAGYGAKIARWCDEYPDALKYKQRGEKRLAVRIAGEVRGKVVADMGLNSQHVVADCTPKPWHVMPHKGRPMQIGECNASEIAQEAGIQDEAIRSTTRVLYEDGTPVSAADHAINDAVKLLIQMMGEDGKGLVLLSNDGEAPYILPALINGAVEYQVSDGIDGKRSTSYDAYTWSEAKKNFDKMLADMTDAQHRANAKM